ncbi:MAG: SurA N-terminal domain-containing protein [Desulfobulbaceae bacterium]|nr:SurA N-terminal domain-containing protein [Desulfobulbaceae bacterium]
MLNLLRKQAQSTVIQILVLIIAIVFVFWGVGTNLGTKRNALATVNGEEIPYEDYQRTYDTAIDNLRIQFGGSIPQGLLDGLGMKQQVINQLVQAEILRQGGRDMGINVSRRETQDEIRSMEVFQQNGRFDLDRYKQILSQNRMTPATFEAGLQNDLLTRRVTEAIEKFAILPESAIQSRYDFANEQIRLAYAAFRSADFADQVVVEEDSLAAWFDQQKNNYLTEPQIRLRYLYFAYNDDLEQVTPGEEELRARYEANLEKYTTPEQRHARHILFKVDESDDAQTRIDKKNKAEEVLEKARAGQDFAELAKQYSEGPTGPSGGDLGFFNRGAMVKQFDDVVFQMEPGEISEIVETVFGYHIIQLEAIRPKVTREFEDVQDSIAAEMQKEVVKGVTMDRARQAYEDIIRSGNLDRYAESANNEVMETDYFAKDSPPGPPVSDPRFLDIAFKLKKGELSSIVPTDSGYAIIFIDDIAPPEVPELEAVREEVVADYIAARSIELAGEAAEAALEEASANGALAAENLGGAVLQQSPSIKRTDPADAGDLPAQVVQKGFELTLQQPFPEQPLHQGETFYVFQLLEKGQGDESLDETRRQVLAEQLTQSAQNRLLTDWLAWRQSKADIWINQQILQ